MSSKHDAQQRPAAAAPGSSSNNTHVEITKGAVAKILCSMSPLSPYRELSSSTTRVGSKGRGTRHMVGSFLE